MANALLQLLLDRHSALPAQVIPWQGPSKHISQVTLSLEDTVTGWVWMAVAALQIEVEVILAAHHLYTENACLDGVDSLVDLTTLSVVRWASQHEHRALATLAAGKQFCTLTKRVPVSATCDVPAQRVRRCCFNAHAAVRFYEEAASLVHAICAVSWRLTGLPGRVCCWHPVNVR